MKEGLRLKFAQNPLARDHLLETGSALLMNQPGTTEWGISYRKARYMPLEACLQLRRTGKCDKLGVALEQIRREIRIKRLHKKVSI